MSVLVSGFVSGSEWALLSERGPLSTGSLELESRIGGVRRGMFYLFYGEERLIESLFQYLLVNAMKPVGQDRQPVVVYMLCGNYRRERTNIGTDALVELFEASGFAMEDALRRVYVFTTSSADQQALLVNELESLLQREADVSLVLVRGIFKLHKDDARVRNRHVVWEEVQRSTIRMRQLCASWGIPIVASGRAVKTRQVLPQPESSSFLRHLANVIVYLRIRGRNSEYNRAFLLNHPARSPGSVEYAFKVNEELGMDTPPFRQSFQDMVSKLRQEFQDALLKTDRRDAFDLLVKAWSAARTEHKNPYRQVMPAWMINGGHQSYDRKKYTTLVRRAADNLRRPFLQDGTLGGKKLRTSRLDTHF